MSQHPTRPGRGSLNDSNVKFYLRFLEHHKFRLFLHILFVDPVDANNAKLASSSFPDKQAQEGKRLVLVPIRQSLDQPDTRSWSLLLFNLQERTVCSYNPGVLFEDASTLDQISASFWQQSSDDNAVVPPIDVMDCPKAESVIDTGMVVLLLADFICSHAVGFLSALCCLLSALYSLSIVYLITIYIATISALSLLPLTGLHEAIGIVPQTPVERADQVP